MLNILPPNLSDLPPNSRPRTKIWRFYKHLSHCETAGFVKSPFTSRNTWAATCFFSKAVEEGIVHGGGVAYLRAVKVLETAEFPGEEQLGVKLIKRALEEPARQIAANADFEGAVVLAHVMETHTIFLKRKLS